MVIDDFSLVFSGDGVPFDNSAVFLDRLLSAVRYGCGLPAGQSDVQWHYHLFHFHGDDVELNRTEWHPIDQIIDGNGSNGARSLRPSSILHRPRSTLSIYSWVIKWPTDRCFCHRRHKSIESFYFEMNEQNKTKQKDINCNFSTVVSFYWILFSPKKECYVRQIVFTR